MLVLHRHKDVVRRLVIDEEFAIAVHDETARGIDDFFAKSVGVGTLAVVIAHELQRE
jgi:hypothetical protein